MYSVKSLVSRVPIVNRSSVRLVVMVPVNNFTFTNGIIVAFQSQSIHTTKQQHKFQTNTEIIHQSVLYGRVAYPSRPNDPRVSQNPNFGITYLHLAEKASSESPDDIAKTIHKEKKINISTAMKLYMEKAKEHNEFINVQLQEFEMGKRHLANMMGINETDMTQKDIDVNLKLTCALVQ